MVSIVSYWLYLYTWSNWKIKENEIRTKIKYIYFSNKLCVNDNNENVLFFCWLLSLLSSIVVVFVSFLFICSSSCSSSSFLWLRLFLISGMTPNKTLSFITTKWNQSNLPSQERKWHGDGLSDKGHPTNIEKRGIALADIKVVWYFLFFIKSQNKYNQLCVCDMCLVHTALNMCLSFLGWGRGRAPKNSRNTCLAIVEIINIISLQVWWS